MHTDRIARVGSWLTFTLLVIAVVLATGTRSSGQPPADRFDYLVRNDFFAGIAGDRARLDRGMKVCEEILAGNPRHAEALVWHGSGLIIRGGQAAQAGDGQTAGQLTARGLEEMERGARLTPTAVGVLIPRAAVLSQLARVPFFASRQREFLETVAAHYATSLALQAPDFSRMSVHARGELLGGLAESLDRLGQHERARHYLTRMVSELPDTPYASRARSWLSDDPPSSRSPLSCVGCHR